ncbi:MAG: hypothetical protein RH982_16315 [Parvibaculum sp.]
MENEHHPHGAGGHHAHPAVSRRTLLVLSGTALVAAAVPAALFLAEPEGPSVGGRYFVGLLADPAGAAELGEIWLGAGGAVATLPVYESRLSRRLAAHGWTPRLDAAETHRVLAEAVRADYAMDRLVEINQWMLSETEADLCALAALEARTGDKTEPAHG